MGNDILCGFLGHKWVYCRCERCGATMGLKRDEISHHDWNGCTCRICGQVRDEEHDWNGCKCRICGKTRDTGHQFENGTCKICGKRVVKEDLLKIFDKAYRYPIEVNPMNLGRAAYEIERFQAQKLDLAYEALPPDDADEILVKAYSFFMETRENDMGNHPPICRRLRTVIVPHVNGSNLLSLYKVTYGNHVKDGRPISNFYWLLDELSDREKLILEACNNSDMDDKGKREFLLECKVADGKLVSPCDIGQHDLVFDRIYRDADGDKYEVYRCKRCGAEIERYAE